MFSADFRRPLFRLATAAVFATAASQVGEVTAQSQCDWHYNYCVNIEHGMLYDINCIPYGDQGCQSCAFACTYGPYYSSCDTCTEV